MLCVVRIGPPPVMITNWSYPLKEPATDMIRARAKVGRTSGIVIEKRIRGFEAPSIFAASVMEGEIADKPAKRMIIDIPNVFHATETLIINREDQVDPSQFFPLESILRVLRM